MSQPKSAESGQRGAIGKHRAGLPAEAALHAILGSPEFEKRLAAYEALNTQATDAQNAYKRFGHLALRCTAVATLMAAVTLIPSVEPEQWIGAAISVVQTIANTASLALVGWIFHKRYVDTWMQSRAQAEMARGALFEWVLEQDAPAGADDKELWRQKLALLLDAHIDYQLHYFANSSSRAVARGRQLSLPRGIGLAATIVAGLIGFFALLNFVRLHVWPLPGWLDAMATWGHIPGHARWQLGLNTAASAFLAYASARVLMDQDERNAALFRFSAQQLAKHKEDSLDNVRQAAAAGQGAAVKAFFAKAQTILEADHTIWLASRPVVPTRQ